MRNYKKLAALSALFAVIAVVVAGCGSSSSSGAVATVAGNPVSQRAMDHWMYVYAKDQTAQQPGDPVIVPKDPPAFTGCIKQIRAAVPTLKTSTNKDLRSDCKEIFTEYKNVVLNFLIEGYWYQGDLAKLGQTITDAQVAKKLKSVEKAQFPTKADLAKYLSESGETEADLHWQVLANLAYQRLLKHFTKKVNAAAISSYYAKHKATFTVPATRDVHLIRTDKLAQAQAAYAALKAGGSWATVAKQYSVDAATKNKGGLLTGVKNGQEENAVNKVIFANPVGKLVGPIKGIFGYYVVDVVSITPAKVDSLATATPEIKELLTSQYQTAAEAAVTKLSKKNFGSSTICKSAWSVSDCAGYKAPKTTAAATSSPSQSSTTG